MAKAPTGCTLEKQKDPRGRILGFSLSQGRKVWHGKTADEAIKAREDDIARLCEDYGDPVILESPTDDPSERMIAYATIQGWKYGFARKPRQYPSIHADFVNVECEIHGNGNYRTRAECERRMRGHAADVAIRIDLESHELKVTRDGLDYFRDGSIELEDIYQHMEKIAWCRGQAMAKRRGLALNAPMAPGELLADAYKKVERDRISDVYRTLREASRIYGSSYDVIASFRAGKLVFSRKVPA